MDNNLFKTILQVKVMTPDRFLYYGQALSVSSINSEVVFSILPQHANFITIVENQPIKIEKPDHQILMYKFSEAIILNDKNQISIYAEPHSPQ